MSTNADVIRSAINYTSGNAFRATEAHEALDALLAEVEQLRAAVEEAAAREHGAGYGSRRKGRRCNLKKIHGCTYCRALAGVRG